MIYSSIFRSIPVPFLFYFIIFIFCTQLNLLKRIHFPAAGASILCTIRQNDNAFRFFCFFFFNLKNIQMRLMTGVQCEIKLTDFPENFLTAIHLI